MEILEVNDIQTEREFFHLPFRIYAGDPLWVAPLEADLRRLFTRGHSGPFRLKRWVLRDGKGVAGRIAAFFETGTREGGMGFFECVEQPVFASALFDKAFQWLFSQEIDRVLAPVNPGERDKYWGLMISGEGQPAFQDNYHPAYYHHFFLQAGFRMLFEQSTFVVQPRLFPFRRFHRLAQRFNTSSGVSCKTLAEMDNLQFARWLVPAYREAWQDRAGTAELDEQRVLELIEEAGPVLRREWIVLAMDGDRCVGFLVFLPDMNPLIQDFKGRWNSWNKLRLLIRLKTRGIERARGILFGVVPEYQGSTVAARMIWHLFQIMEQDRVLREVELSWIGSFNPAMLALVRSLGGREVRKHITLVKDLKSENQIF